MQALSSNSLSYTTIPRFSEQPIRQIPRYVFENCNQVTYNIYLPQYLEALKGRVKDLKSPDLLKMCGGSKAKFEKKGEEFDWVNGLDELEREFGNEPSKLPSLLTSETVMRYNGIFSRFSNDSPGEFRKKDIVWKRRELDINEEIAAALYDSALRDQTNLTQHEYFNSSNQKKCVVSKTWVFKKYCLLKNQGMEIQGSEETKQKMRHLDLGTAAAHWAAKQGRTDRKIDVVQWFKERYHYFPLVSTLEEDLEKSLEFIKTQESHPIEKACRIWLDIVRIHISHEANKRTGKAIASVILLSHGYLPPKIGKDDEKEYLAVLQKGIESEEGRLEFTQFIMKMMTNTFYEYSAT